MHDPIKLMQGRSKPINVSLTTNLEQALRAQSRKENRPISRIVRLAVLHYLIARDRPPREELHDHGEECEYQEHDGTFCAWAWESCNGPTDGCGFFPRRPRKTVDEN